MKLETQHLKGELQRILNEDGISAEELASASGVHPTTIYAILRGRHKNTQRAIGRKIAEGTGREFTIDQDKIYFTKKPAEATVHEAKHFYGSRELFPGLLMLQADEQLCARWNITEHDIAIAAQTRLYGGKEKTFSVEQWLEIILLLKKLNIE